MGTDTFPVAALEWLAPTRPGELLAVGVASAPIARRLVPYGQEFWLIDDDAQVLVRQRVRTPEVKPLVTSVDALPFSACMFETIVVSHVWHTVTTSRTLPELARVLVPGGRLVVHYTVRDDSVPWVRRLAVILHEIDPSAMVENHQLDSVKTLETSPYFRHVERRDFRLWVPCSRQKLLDDVSANDRVTHTDDVTRSRILREVGHLYDSSARAPEPLLLPYTVACWRAEVDHSEFSIPLGLFDDGFRISL